jgi:hypothetical protein
MPVLQKTTPPGIQEVAARNTARWGCFSRRYTNVLLATLLSVIVVTTSTSIFLSRDLPEETADTRQYPVTDFNFVFGSGHLEGELMLADQFADGYALLSSGPVNMQADQYRVLSYTWLPPRIPQEAAFFWRRADNPQNVSRTDITTPGTQLIDLSTEAEWQGEIIEFGFLIAGENGKPVGIGKTSLIPDSLNIRARLSWEAWTAFEERSQKSINFIYGGGYRQVVPLPLLVFTWLGFTLLFLWLLQRFGTNTGHLRMITCVLFLFAWILLDIRWATNNLKQIQLSLGTYWRTDEQQRMSNGLDGEVYQYVQRLKSSVLGNQNARILIIGDENAVDYYLLRAKYHLLPHSANVAGHFAKELKPKTVDFVIVFGEPASIARIPGWNQVWQHSLTLVDRGEWGEVYRVK